jgi:polysaccharide export outer membrane protein
MAKNRLIQALGALAILTLAACAGGPAPLPMAPAGPGADSAAGPLTLRPGDIVKVQVFGHEELSGEFPVDENTNLILPIVGEFSVSGLSVAEVRAKIRREFGQLYTQSFVAITPLFRVAVLGEVQRPGLYSVDPTMTIYDVVAQAGGTTRQATENQMRLLRAGQAYSFGLQAQSVARSTMRELGIRSGDQLIIPRKALSQEAWYIMLQLGNTLLLAYSIFR